MAEINRVYHAVAAFFDASGIEKIGELTEAIQKTINKANRRLNEVAASTPYSKRGDDFKEVYEKRLAKIKEAESVLQSAGENLDPKDKDGNKLRFQQAAKAAMVVRRAGYTLANPEASYLPDIDPEDALMDDDDAYAFAIFDTLAEDVQFTLPPLYGLAMEGETYEDEEAPV